MLSSTSLAAYRSLDLTDLESTVALLIEGFGAAGCTVDEIRKSNPDIDYQTLTPRFAPLEKKGVIFRAGDTRPGHSTRQQKVMRSVLFAETFEHFPLVKLATAKKNPFIEGMKFAAKTILRESDFSSAKRALRIELEKVARR